MINISSSVLRCGQVNRFSISKLLQHLTAILHLLHRRPRGKPSIPIFMLGMWSSINIENRNLKAELISNSKINIFTKYTKSSFVTDAFHRTGLPYPRPKTPPGETSGPATEEEVQVRKFFSLLSFLDECIWSISL